MIKWLAHVLVVLANLVLWIGAWFMNQSIEDNNVSLVIGFILAVVMVIIDFCLYDIID